ncbi:MAG: nucleotide sugar dehydrogenase [Conexibacter sp.]|nr:nucleotide sugar dehydrogenase [Conexibacter sp.]
MGVVGLGYVGLPLAVSFADRGVDVIGVDIDPRRVDEIRAGTAILHDDTATPELLALVTATTDFAQLAAADAVIICVPTPLSPNREPDLAPLVTCARELAQVLQRGQLVVLESTTFPGTTRERLAPILEASGLRAGADFALAYSPERLDPGRPGGGLRHTPKLVAGLTPACRERAEALYRRVCDEVVPVSSPDVAEFSKLLENVFRSVNIALVNELALLADRMGLDIWEIVDAAATKPYGFMRFDPGPGMGGHCLPVDPFYLSWRAREFDFACEFVELAGKVNLTMPVHCAARVQRALNSVGLPVKGARILVLGVSYKPGIPDTRESPALPILATLGELGGDMAYHDPHVPRLAHAGLASRPLDEALSWADVAVIVTAHPEVDHDAVAERARLVVDLRGVTQHIASDTVVRL